MTTFRLLAAATVVASLGLPRPAPACFMPPPAPPPDFWLKILGDTDGNGLTEIKIGIEVGPFATTGAFCACGIGIGNLALPAPGGIQFLDAFATITSRQLIGGQLVDVNTPVPEFDPLAPNPVTAAGLAAGPGATPGATWGGFFGSIGAFNPQVLGPNEVYKLWFVFELPTSQVGLLDGLPVQFATGKGLPDGNPDFNNPLHPVGYFSAVNSTITLVPEPTSVALAGLGGAVLAGRAPRRRPAITT